MDVNTRKMKKSPFLLTRDRDRVVARLRIPGGALKSSHLTLLQDLADTFGNGMVHFTTNQVVEIPGIPFTEMSGANNRIQEIAGELGLNERNLNPGESTVATRNASACIGSRVCPYACYDTKALVDRIENEVFPNAFHFHIALTGCHADCAGTRLFDFAVIGMTLPQYNPDRCVGCQACIKSCNRHVAALTEVNYKVDRDHRRCFGCGDCVMNCPTGAWTRSREPYFRLALMGRTGKRNPRLAENFLKWADADAIIAILKNSRDYVKHHRDSKAPGGKEHIGHIIDRTGFAEYRKWALKDVRLPKTAEAREVMNWGGIAY